MEQYQYQYQEYPPMYDLSTGMVYNVMPTRNPISFTVKDVKEEIKEKRKMARRPTIYSEKHARTEHAPKDRISKDEYLNEGPVATLFGYANCDSNSLLNYIDRNKELRMKSEREYFMHHPPSEYSSLNDRIRYYYSHGIAFPIEKLDDLRASMVINLFTTGFSLGSQTFLRPYDHSSEEFIKSIDSKRMTPDLLELLEETPCYYYEGCLVIELRDYRGISKYYSGPTIRKILLRPDSDSITSDIEALIQGNPDLSHDELIEIERSILHAIAQPLCLDPSPAVGLITNALVYNKLKYNFKRKRSKIGWTPPFSESVPLISTNEIIQQSRNICQDDSSNQNADGFALFKFLVQRVKSNPNAFPPNSVVFGSLLSTPPLSHSGPVAAGKQRPISFPKLPPRPVQFNPQTSLVLRQRSMRFQRGNGRFFATFDMYPNDRGTYSGRFRAGTAPDSGTNGSSSTFSLGNAIHCKNFVRQLLRALDKEGWQLLYDSAFTEQRQQVSSQQPEYMAILRAQGTGARTTTGQAQPSAVPPNNPPPATPVNQTQNYRQNPAPIQQRVT